MAQVFPVLMLALIWESGYLERLRTQVRPSRRADPVTGVFWTKPRVRAWIIAVSGIAVGEVGLTAAVLASAVPEGPPTRAIVLAGLAVVLGTLLTRACVDIWHSTKEPEHSPASSHAPDR